MVHGVFVLHLSEFVQCRVVFSVFGAIAVCLFPLWPPEVRLGVYYLSVAAACFVGLIFVLCIGKRSTLSCHICEKFQS